MIKKNLFTKIYLEIFNKKTKKCILKIYLTLKKFFMLLTIYIYIYKN